MTILQTTLHLHAVYRSVPLFFDSCRLHKLETREFASTARVKFRPSVRVQEGEGAEGVPWHYRRD
jgi:hypothetical protein